MLILIAVLVILIDPFVHYHAPYFGLAAVETEERGQMIGVARYMDYDTAIVGSSMCENFRASWFNDNVLGNNTVKLPMRGGHFDDYSKLLNIVLSKLGIKTVIISLDNYMMLQNPDEYPSTVPSHLENDDVLDDIYYLWNKSVTFLFLPVYIINNVENGFSADNAYCLSDRYRFDKYVARADYLKYRLMQKRDEERFDTYYQNTGRLIDGMTSYIEAYPEVEFIFFSPPYSILYWDDCILRGRLTAEICAQNELFNSLLAYDNVRIFYFQDDWDVITDLDNYMDYSHFNKDISYYIYECMRDGKKEVTKETSFDTLLKFSEDVAAYDHESSFH
ncbi:MAG: hypothetical protein K6G22_13635 [Lachnospiraceae bacterium]|nr:hypothetical protein [Lachnospiraceae bacterium]